MSNITLFTLETANEIYNSIEGFPVDFDIAWQWLEYSRKDNAKANFVKFDFVESIDYQILNMQELRPQGGFSNREVITLTVDCFKTWGMMAGTEKAKQIRKYFLECERLAKLNYANKPVEQVEQAKPDPTMIKGYEVSARISTQLGDRDRLAMTVHQLNDYLAQFKPEKPVERVLDARQIKIYADLVKFCKGQPVKPSQMSNSSLSRRNDVLAVYGDKTMQYLHKKQTLDLFSDAAKHGYGKFDLNSNTFTPFDKQ